MYKVRHIKFKEIISVAQWKVKAYTISKNINFQADVTYAHVLKKLPDWLNQFNSFDASHENIAFLIVHEGTEGVFSLINTWVGKNMLQTHIFISKFDTPTSFEKISGDGLFACIWELEVINHEKDSWVNHILKKQENPDYQSYLEDTFSVTI